MPIKDIKTTVYIYYQKMTNNNFSFTINENYNYYTIRQKARDRYYKQMKEDGWKYGDIKTMMADEMSACCGWKEAEEIALSLNTTETVQQFYDKLQETDYNVLVPPKKWLNMTISVFVPFILHELNFYRLSKKKKDFFSILLNYYINN